MPKGDKKMLFHINTILDLIEKYNEGREEYYQLDIFDILCDIDDLENEEDIERAIKELKNRVQ